MTKARTLADNYAADINQVSAGVGITGGGTSGTVTVTNSMATAIDAKGDLVVGTGADTFSRLAVASTAGYLLSVDSAEATGLKWSAPPSSGGMTSLASGNLSTSSNTLSLTSISGSYNDLRLIVRDIYPANNGYVFQITVNSVADYDYIYDTGGAGFVGGSATFNPYYDPSTNTNDENFIILDFKDYTNTTSDKSIASFYHYNSIRPRTGEVAVVWGAASTTSAIDTITLTIQAGGGNWGAAGSYVLYGIK